MADSCSGVWLLHSWAVHLSVDVEVITCFLGFVFLFWGDFFLAVLSDYLLSSPEVGA